jgi:hypothetical protein
MTSAMRGYTPYMLSLCGRRQQANLWWRVKVGFTREKIRPRKSKDGME